MLRRRRSSEIQRATIAPKSARKRSRANARSVLRRNLCTRSGYLRIQAKIAKTTPRMLKIDIIPAGIILPVRMNAGRK